MKITILTNRDLASHIALTRLVQGLSDHQLNIFISEKVGRNLLDSCSLGNCHEIF